MKKFLKVLSFILAFCLCLAMLPATAIAEYELSTGYEELSDAEPGEFYGKTVIIYTANIRGNIYILPQIATLRSFYKAKDADVILVDVGNYLQGTVYSTYDSGRTVTQLMYKTGYDVVAIGSREFDFGTGQIGVAAMHGMIHEDEALEELLEEVSFHAISSNIIDDEYKDYAFEPNVVITMASGREIGFFGLTDPDTVNQVLESNIDGLTFNDVAEAAAYQAYALAENDLVVGLTNVGTPLVVSGAIIIDVYSGAGLTVGVIIIENETNRVLAHSLVNLAAIELDKEMQYAVETAMESIYEEFQGAVARTEVTLVGSAAASRSGETNTGNLWTNALRWFALEGGIVNFFDEDDIDAGNDRIMADPENVVAIWNGGNLRDFLNIGDVTIKDLQRVLPFPNRVAVMYLTGAQLLEMLEAATQGLPFTSETFAAAAAFPHVAGIEFTVDTTIPFDAGEAYGNHWYRANTIRRVTINSVNGNDFDPEATYAVITSNAIFNGMDSNYISLERCEEYSTITSAFVVDVVWMYIMQELGGVIDERYAQPQGRITVVTGTEE